MEEEKLRELISVQELLDDEDDEAFNVCTKGGKKYNDITLVKKTKSFNLYILYIHVHDLDNSLMFNTTVCRCSCTYILYSTYDILSTLYTGNISFYL